MTFKVLIIGDAGVGKTSLRNQYFHKTFHPSYRATIGANFLTKSIRLDDTGQALDQTLSNTTSTDYATRQETLSRTASSAAVATLQSTRQECVSLCIWDTAGQERFNSLSPTFYRGSDCAILLYDMTNRQSLENLTNHHREFLKYSGTANPVIAVVGNKADAMPLAVSSAEARRLINERFPQEQDRRSEAWRQEDTAGRPQDVIECYEVSAKFGTSVERLFVDIATMCHSRDKRRELLAFEVDEQDGHRSGYFGKIDLSTRPMRAGCHC